MLTGDVYRVYRERALKQLGRNGPQTVEELLAGDLHSLAYPDRSDFFHFFQRDPAVRALLGADGRIVFIRAGNGG